MQIGSQQVITATFLKDKDSETCNGTQIKGNVLLIEDVREQEDPTASLLGSYCCCTVPGHQSALSPVVSPFVGG